MLARRDGNLTRLVSGAMQYASSYTVTAYRPGGVASANSSGTTITLYKGHGFRVGDKFLVNPGSSNTFSGLSTVQSYTDTTIVMGSSHTISSGDVLVNLGPDAGVSAPDYTASDVVLYSTPDRTSTITQSRVTADATGNYGYWHDGGSFWELIRDASGTPANSVRESFGHWNPRVIYANQYATGGGGTASNPWTGWESVIQKALDADPGRGTNYPRGVHVHFPAGVYQTTTSGVFSDITFSGGATRRGLLVTGDGAHVSLIRFGTLSAETWYFDNYTGSVHENSWQFVKFQDLGFQGKDDTGLSANDVSAFAKGFRVQSTGQEQCYEFHSCLFQMLHSGFDLQGSNTASEFKFVACRFSKIKDVVYKINNVQSVNHEFVSCDIWDVQGDVIEIGSSGGGLVKVWGGSWILVDNDATPTQENFALSIPSGGVGSTNSPLVFENVAFELKEDYTGLVSVAAESTVDIQFRKCRWIDSSAGRTRHREIVRVHNLTSLTFSECVHHEQQNTYEMQYRMKGTTNQRGVAGRIWFDRCQIPFDEGNDNTNFASRINFDTATVGKVIATGCFAKPSSIANVDKYALDFNLNALYGSSCDSQIPLHRAVLVNLNTGLPRYNGAAFEQERVIMLPPNQRIVNIYFSNGGGTGGTANNIQYHVGTDDKLTTYGSSTLAAQNVAHSIVLTNQYVSTGTAANTRKVRLWATQALAHNSHTGGFMVVEYL